MDTERQSLFPHGQDLPLFSGTPQQASAHNFTPDQPPKQLTWANCKLCQDTGTLQDKGKKHYCTCDAGLKIRAKLFD